MDLRLSSTLWAICLAGTLVVQCSQAKAQQQGPPGQGVGGASAVAANRVADVSELPDAPDFDWPRQQDDPSPTLQPSQAGPEGGQQTKRILWILPNFRSVSVNSHPPAQSPKEKFVDVVHDSFDYTSFVFIGVLAGVSQLQGSTPEFHTGAPAYGRYYWHNFADQTDENLWVGFVLPVALHEDARYYTLGNGTAQHHNGLFKRAGYAFSRILVTRKDSGGSSFNFSEVVGAGASAGISNLYYPSSNRGWNKTGQRWALNVGIDGSTFILKEFWPDLNRAIFHTK